MLLSLMPRTLICTVYLQINAERYFDFFE